MRESDANPYQPDRAKILRTLVAHNLLAWLVTALGDNRGPYAFSVQTRIAHNLKPCGYDVDAVIELERQLFGAINHLD
jgi:hypothetical protein